MEDPPVVPRRRRPWPPGFAWPVSRCTRTPTPLAGPDARRVDPVAHFRIRRDRPGTGRSPATIASTGCAMKAAASVDSPHRWRNHNICKVRSTVTSFSGWTERKTHDQMDKASWSRSNAIMARAEELAQEFHDKGQATKTPSCAIPPSTTARERAEVLVPRPRPNDRRRVAGQ